MTAILPSLRSPITVLTGVYPPQQDSRLLINTLERTTLVVGRTVADLCCGTGVLAITAARLGAASVTAWDISPVAVECARGNADSAGLSVDVRNGSLAQARRHGPYDVVVSNPPYVPTPDGIDWSFVPATAGPEWAWNAGEDGRQILDPLCAGASELLNEGGTMLIVQSEFAGIEESITSLETTGLSAAVVARQRIPLGQY